MIKNTIAFRTKRSQMHGATMVEAAIAFPIFILLLFGIFGFSQFIAQRVAIEDAFRASIREVSLQPADTTETECKQAVVAKFQEKLKQASLPGSVKVHEDKFYAVAALDGAHYDMKNWAGNLDSGPAINVRGITITAETEMDCGGFCSFLLKTAGRYNTVVVGAFVPLEDPEACQCDNPLACV